MSLLCLFYERPLLSGKGWSHKKWTTLYDGSRNEGPDDRGTTTSLHPLTCTEDVLASIAAGGEIVVMAVGAEKLFLLGGERLVHQRTLAVAALETLLMPVLVLVGQILERRTMKHNN